MTTAKEELVQRASRPMGAVYQLTLAASCLRSQAFAKSVDLAELADDLDDFVGVLERWVKVEEEGGTP